MHYLLQCVISFEVQLSSDNYKVLWCLWQFVYIVNIVFALALLNGIYYVNTKCRIWQTLSYAIGNSPQCSQTEST